MNDFFRDNFFLSIFIIFFLIVMGIRLLIWIIIPTLRSSFFNLKDVLISAFIAVLMIFVGFFVFFYVFSEKGKTERENKYTEEKSAKPRILILETETYANIGKPTYMGEKIIVDGFKVNDTVFSMASFQKGRETFGKYMLVNYKGKQFWMSEYANYSLDYCSYAYYKQPVDFVAKNEQENAIFWERANKYAKEFENKYDSVKYEDKTAVFNDTLIKIQYDYGSRSDGWEISRKKIKGEYGFFTKRNYRKGSFSYDYYRDCAYFIQYGKYCKEE